MTHKKLITSSITVATLFSFGITKPMVLKNRSLKTYVAKKLNTFENLTDTNIQLFENLEHLKKICELHENLELHGGMSKLQKTVKVGKSFADWGPFTVAIGWTLKNLLKRKSLTSYIIPGGIGILGGTYHFLYGKKQVNNVVKTWEKTKLGLLYNKQSLLMPHLTKINNNKYDLNENKDWTLKSLALLRVFETNAKNSENFNPLEKHDKLGGPFDIRKIYKEKGETVQTKLGESYTQEINKYRSRAEETIKSFMCPKQNKKQEPITVMTTEKIKEIKEKKEEKKDKGEDSD